MARRKSSWTRQSFYPIRFLGVFSRLGNLNWLQEMMCLDLNTARSEKHIYGKLNATFFSIHVVKCANAKKVWVQDVTWSTLIDPWLNLCPCRGFIFLLERSGTHFVVQKPPVAFGDLCFKKESYSDCIWEVKLQPEETFPLEWLNTM